MSADAAPPGGDINKGPLVLGLCTVSTSLGLAAVVTRMFVRVRIVRNVGWDDYAILVAAVSTSAPSVPDPRPHGISSDDDLFLGHRHHGHGLRDPGCPLRQRKTYVLHR